MSLNPAIDKRLSLELLERGKVNRVIEATPEPGGKSLHVAMVLHTLGANPLWIGFSGGATGKELLDGIRRIGIRTQAIEIEKPTRTNLEILENDGTVTEILEPGPALTEGEQEQFQRTYENTMRDAGPNGIVVLSGSLPLNVPSDFYSSLIRIGHQNGSRVFLDTSGEPLKQALNAGPDFVKPNQHEAEWLTESAIFDHQAAQIALEKILGAGARAAAVSLGAAGMVYRSSTDENAMLATVPNFTVRSTTGSGDATVAGFVFASKQGLGAAEALRLAAACGTANCLADGPGKVRAADIERLKGEIQIRVLQKSERGS